MQCIHFDCYRSYTSTDCELTLHIHSTASRHLLVPARGSRLCPPILILRRVGFRTQPEISEERYALKALRGDFQGLKDDTKQMEPSQILAAVRS